MAEEFTELGIGPELVTVLEQHGMQRPTAVQRAAIPVLRRGGNVVLHAATGAGATIAYGVALAERLREGVTEAPALLALVVTPSDERARAVALELGQLAEPAGIRAGVFAAGWQGTPHIAVVSIDRALDLLESSTLKLDEAKILVLHDVSAMLALGQQTTLDTLLPAVPRGAQRVIVTSELNNAVEKLAEAHVRKALHVPARPALRDESAGKAATARIEYQVVAGNAARQALAELLAGAQNAVVFCRTTEECTGIGEELKLRGFAARTRHYGEELRTGEAAFGLGTPFDAESLSAALPNGGAVVIEPRELTHLRNIARQANVQLQVMPPRPGDASALGRFRDNIRRALQEEDIEAQLLVIEPLLQEFSAAEVAAATTALLRKREPVREPAAARAAAPAPAAPPAFVKLFLSVGQRDGIAPREIVGAITGEANIKGEQVGRVEIRDTFSIVEVDADAAEKVIRSLNGTSLRGRSVRVDYDRKASTQQRRPTPGRRSFPQ